MVNFRVMHRLHSAIEEFRASKVTDAFADVIPVASLADPNVAQAQCNTIGAAFAQFLIERGLQARLVGTNDCADWGLQYVPGPGANPDPYHAATLVDGVVVDWTANQFPGQHEFPRVIPASTSQSEQEES